MALSRELQVQIDDVYACRGSCPGCVLSVDERKAAEPDMAPSTLALVIDRLDEYLRVLPPVESINITWGAADHMLVDDDHNEQIYHLGARVIRNAGLAGATVGEGSAVFFTTALIGRPDHFMPRLRRLADARTDVPLIPVVILDPAKLYARKFGTVYEGMILETHRLFGKVDLTVNLSDEAVARISPDDLHDFAADNGFHEVTINWTPTTGNLPRTTGAVDRLADWLIAFDERVNSQGRITTGYRPVMLRVVDAVMCSFGDLTAGGTAPVADSLLPPTIQRSIHIDHAGNLLPKFEAVGDVPHSDRFGYAAIGNLRDGSIAELLDAAMDTLKARVVSAHARTRACASCTYAGFCAAAGFHVYNHVMRPVAKGRDACPHVAWRLFDHFYRQAAAARGETPEPALAAAE